MRHVEFPFIFQDLSDNLLYSNTPPTLSSQNPFTTKIRYLSLFIYLFIYPFNYVFIYLFIINKKSLLILLIFLLLLLLLLSLILLLLFLLFLLVLCV